MPRNRNIDNVKCLCVTAEDMETVMALVVRGGLHGTEKELAAAQEFVEENLRALPDRALHSLISEIDNVLQPFEFDRNNTGKLVAVCTSVQLEQKRRRQTNGE